MVVVLDRDHNSPWTALPRGVDSRLGCACSSCRVDFMKFPKYRDEWRRTNLCGIPHAAGGIRGHPVPPPGVHSHAQLRNGNIEKRAQSVCPTLRNHGSDPPTPKKPTYIHVLNQYSMYVCRLTPSPAKATTPWKRPHLRRSSWTSGITAHVPGWSLVPAPCARTCCMYMYICTCPAWV